MGNEWITSCSDVADWLSAVCQFLWIFEAKVGQRPRGFRTSCCWSHHSEYSVYSVRGPGNVAGRVRIDWTKWDKMGQRFDKDDMTELRACWACWACWALKTRCGVGGVTKSPISRRSRPTFSQHLAYLGALSRGEVELWPGKDFFMTPQHTLVYTGNSGWWCKGFATRSWTDLAIN